MRSHLDVRSGKGGGAMSAVLRWRSVTPSTSPKFLVKGTELNHALAGECSRFQLCEHRIYDADGHADREYLVRDAEQVTDADMREHKRPPIVARFAGLDEALEFINGP
jgi:hypothetical protein